jgi:predicted nucleic acid-binding protein
MKPSVYLDATIPSFYHEERPLPQLQEWRRQTIRFWESAQAACEMLVSDETVRELEETGYPDKKRRLCLELIRPLRRLSETPEILELAQFYMRESVMPEYDSGDAVHLAFATRYRVQYLLTWNCKHLANPNKFSHIQTLHTRRGLDTPFIVTPEQFMEICP